MKLTATFKFKLLSSTTSIFLPVKFSALSSSTISSSTSALELDSVNETFSVSSSCFSEISWFKYTVNLVPAPAAVWTIILPPSNSTKLFVIDNSSPDASLLFISSSNLEYLSNSFSTFFWLIPTPLSSTVITSEEVFSLLIHVTFKSM